MSQAVRKVRGDFGLSKMIDNRDFVLEELFKFLLSWKSKLFGEWFLSHREDSPLPAEKERKGKERGT